MAVGGAGAPATAIYGGSATPIYMYLEAQWAHYIPLPPP